MKWSELREDRAYNCGCNSGSVQRDVVCSFFKKGLIPVWKYIIIIILLKKVSSARLRESNVHPLSPKTPVPQYQPIDRKKRKEKTVEDNSKDRAA